MATPAATAAAAIAPSSSSVNPQRLVPLTTLGRGSYGKVILARNEADDPPLVAVKVVSKTRIKTKGQLVKNETELRVMREVAPGSPFLVGTLGGYQTDHCLFYLMPYNAGGELFFHLQQKGHFLERETRQIAMQVVLALDHLHSNGIVYRDLKPENVLINNRGVCQLADFGLSKYLPKNGAAPPTAGRAGGSEQNDQLPSSPASVTTSTALAKTTSAGGAGTTRRSSQNMLLKPALGVASRIRNILRRSMTLSSPSPPRTSKDTQRIATPTVSSPASTTSTTAAMSDVDPSHAWGRTKTRCGSPAYQSPEVVEAREHGLEADWWALGIFIYELLVGHPPFFADTVKEVYELILRNEPRWSRKLTDNARDIVQRLLKTDPKQRLGYGEQDGRGRVMAHGFFVNVEPAVAGQERYATWDEVRRQDTKPCVFLSETGVVGRPEDAIFFHSEYTSIDVREYAPLMQKKVELEGFKHVSVDVFGLFVSPDPIPVGNKGGDDGTVKKA